MRDEMEKDLNDCVIRLVKNVKPDLNIGNYTDTELFNQLDSFDMIVLVTELESELNIKIPGEEIRPENFNSPATVVSLIKNLQS